MGSAMDVKWTTDQSDAMIHVDDLSNAIALRMEDKSIQVLCTMCKALKYSLLRRLI